VVEQRPQQDGRNMTMMLGPSKAVLAGTLGEDEEGDADGEPVAEEGVSLNCDSNGNGDIESTSDATSDTEPETTPDTT
jgi:translation initiation factor IF-3